MIPVLDNLNQILVAACSTLASQRFEKCYKTVKLCRVFVACSTRKCITDSTEQKQDILFSLCQRRHFISGDTLSRTTFLQGLHCLGPLGVELKRNLVAQWLNSVVLHRDQVLMIESLHHLLNQASFMKNPLLDICTEHFRWPLQNIPPTHSQADLSLGNAMGDFSFLRPELLYGALQQYVPCLELVNKNLPFGIAEIGKCFHSSPCTENKEMGQTRMGERTVTSLVWFNSPKTSDQWQDYWLRNRVQWWQRFAQNPSGFGCIDQQDNHGRKVSLIQYSFPWGKETIESLCSLEDSALSEMHSVNSTKLYARDGRKSVIPHLLWVSGNLDLGLLVYLSDALQLMEDPLLHSMYQKREVLKLHPTLAPIKVAVDMGKGPTADLRLVCQGLVRELRENGLNVWPGYLETLHGPVEQLFTKYDEMGVLFTVIVSENTLENGLLYLRSRDTTLKDKMHISQVKDLIMQYITAAKHM